MYSGSIQSIVGVPDALAKFEFSGCWHFETFTWSRTWSKYYFVIVCKITAKGLFPQIYVSVFCFCDDYSSTVYRCFFFIGGQSKYTMDKIDKDSTTDFIIAPVCLVMKLGVKITQDPEKGRYRIVSILKHFKFRGLIIKRIIQSVVTGNDYLVWDNFHPWEGLWIVFILILLFILKNKSHSQTRQT